MMSANRIANFSSVEALAPANSTLRVHNGTSHAAHPAVLDGRPTADSKLKSILVPLDGSVFAEQALPMAVALAEQSGAVLNLVHVVVAAEMLDPYDALHFADASIKSLKRDKHRYLEKVIGRIAGTSSAFVAARVVDGRAVAASLNEMPGLDADLVVMATHGRGALGRFWSGSVAHNLLRRMSAPVILVRATNNPVTFDAKPIDHVLLPFDGSDASEEVLRPIVDLGMFPAARHSLMHVVPLEPKHVSRNYVIQTHWVPSRRRWMTGMQYLHPLARSLRADGRTVHTNVISSDEPFWQVVLRTAEQDNAGLIAVAHQRQRPIGRLLWPNTSETLFRNSSRPIMFVPAELHSGG